MEGLWETKEKSGNEIDQTHQTDCAFRFSQIMRVQESRLKLCMIRKLKSGQYRLYSRKRNPETGERRNLGTFNTLEAAKRHERQVQFFKRQ